MGFSFEEAQAQPKRGFSFEEAQAPADPKIGQPEELSFAEKYIAPLLEKAGLGDQGVAGQLGVSRGGAVGRLAMGAADPGVAAFQLAANAVGQGDAVNKRISDVERWYQEARKENGSEGFDPLRLAGNTGMTIFAGAATPAVNALEKLGVYGKAAVQGAGYSALQPVTDGGDDYWKEKAKQALIGAVAGPATALVGGAAARIISPNASVNPEVQMLREAGVRPSVGQTLGGWANALEEKAMSLPILGDAIASARRRGVTDFNNAVLNTATAPIGEKVAGTGFNAVGETGSKLGAAYNKAADAVGHVNLDTPTFNAKLGELMDMAQNLEPSLRDRFQRVLDTELLRRMSPNGSVAGAEIKNVDSALGGIAAKWRNSTDPAQREFGDAVRQLQQVFRDGLAEADPTYKAAKDAADQGWRVFRLARNAAASAQNREGVFSPAQFNSAIRADAGRNAVGEGKAFMQDVGQAAQNVLGNKYPDSGTVGRLLVNLAAVPGHVATSGATALGLGVGSLAYTPVVQNALRAAILKRPDSAPEAANALRRIMQRGSAVAVPLIQSMAR